MEENTENQEVLQSFFNSFQKILAIKIPEGQPPILYKYKTPEKKIAQEIKQKKDLRHKKIQKMLEKKKNYEKETDIVKEKALRKTALKGIIKIFNEIATAQVKNKEEKIKEGIRKQSDRFKRRMKRITESTQTRKMINYTVEKPKWNVLREDFSKIDTQT
jgi:molecular chaperone DnaK (HSP70)